MSVIAVVALMFTGGCRDGAKHEQHTEPKPGAGHSHGHGEPVAVADDFEGPGQLSLPDDLRALIIAEMLQVETAMHRVLSSLVRGDLDIVATTARQVHDSFVLEQKLTDDQTAALAELLPAEFVSLDSAFHLQAEHLEKAAETGNAAEASEVYARMTEGCVGCHRAYARKRFTGLAHSADTRPADPTD